MKIGVKKAHKKQQKSETNVDFCENIAFSEVRMVRDQKKTAQDNDDINDELTNKRIKETYDHDLPSRKNKQR